MKNLAKHLMKVTSKNNTRPVLNGVEFNSSTKRMNATDSHRLLSFEYDGESIRDKVINLETMEVIDSSYPDISRIMPIDGYDFEVPFHEITREIVSLLTKNKKHLIKMTFKEDLIQFYVKTQNERTLDVIDEPIFTIEITKNDDWKKTEEIFLSAEYLRDVFSFLLDYKTESSKTCFTLRFVGRVRPILFSSEKFEYLVTPIRTY
ncbi:hypothetical protein [Enterococcus entomosocium]|uniref:hypothetical protein n=1 Tax=Enterococcus entomosocium TaxID=3034352 RepID=UPI002649DB3D|nr:hypothetical protein [Enterococcus entomosocium]